MHKLTRTTVFFFLGLVSASGAYAVNEASNNLRVSENLYMVKDTVGMDDLINLLQQGGTVKSGLFPHTLRGRIDEKTAYSLQLPRDELYRSEETTEFDLGTLISGFILVGVIALRRLS